MSFADLRMPVPVSIFFITALAFFPERANAAVDFEIGFVFSTFLQLLSALLVMWMCAGFTMLEAGSVRRKNVATVCLKNIGLYSIVGVSYYLIGYNLMYLEVGDFIGKFQLFFEPTTIEIALVSKFSSELISELASELTTAVSSSTPSSSFWFFEMVFVATAGSIVSGTLSERVNIWSFFVFTVFLVTFIYPVVGAWTWGGGWLAKLGFMDFAGSTIVHSVGGWAAVAGAIVVGPRLHKFRADGSARTIPPSNILALTLGAFILWLGFFGFNGGSVLSMNRGVDVISIGVVFVNTNLSACAGVLVVALVSRLLLKVFSVAIVLNGALAGLVAITAGPTFVNHIWAIVIGTVAGLISVFGVILLEKLKIDDGVGAIPVHLLAGTWGTLAVSIAAGGDLVVQAIGVLAIGVFTFSTSLLIWIIIDKIMGARINQDAEEMGQDKHALGMESYPEFIPVPEDWWLKDDQDNGR